MSERMSAYIQIGGRIRRSRAKQLITRTSASGVSLDWGDALFEPKSVEDLLANLKDDRIWLCDNQAYWGEFLDLEQTCRQLGLSYTRCCDGGSAYDAERVEWRPGMKEPMANKASCEHADEILVPASEAKEAIALLKAGKMQQGLDRLKALCPDIPDLPPFRIV